MKYTVQWDAKVQRSVEIEANSEEEAHRKWVNGDYGKTDVDDEDLENDYIEINGKAYKYNEFEEYK